MKRECGECSLCCKVMGVPEVKPERHSWCPHADPGRGCKIYEKRPLPCQQFVCLWLIDEKLGEHWYPAKSKILIDYRDNVLCFVVDPAYPRRWLEQPWLDDIKTLARHGHKTGKWSTAVLVKGDRIPVLAGPAVRLAPASRLAPGSAPSLPSGLLRSIGTHTPTT